MKEDQTHIIKRQRYEIELTNASKSYEYQSKISRLQEQNIQFVLQKVMDQHHSANHLDQYDEITLDLGSITAANFEHEIAYKIEEAFVQFFKSNTYSNGSLIKGKRKSIHKTQIDQFVFFLKNGHLHWDTPSALSPKVLLSEAFKNNKEALITALKLEGKKEYIRTRLISQLKDDSLEQIVLAVKKDEGKYINESRKEIIQHQEEQPLVETNKQYFRNAVWEIILAYIFTEVAGHSNQKSFLQYLIRKIAAKYNLTYKNLLKKIVLGIKENKNKRTGYANFGKLVFQLQEEEEQKEFKTVHRIKEHETLQFHQTLKYYLEHNSLPLSSAIKTYASFEEYLKIFIVKEPVAFQNVFFNFLQQNTTKALQLADSFSNEISTYIISNTNNAVLNQLSQFIKELQSTANSINSDSNTFKQIEKQLGKFSLRVYIKAYQSGTKPVDEFLLEVLKTSTLDDNFIQILKTFTQQNNSTTAKSSNQFITSFITAVSSQQLHSNTKLSTELERFSEKLYPFYAKKETKSLAIFQSTIAASNYTIPTLQLTTVFLDVFSKNTSSSKEVLADWLHKRLLELDKKGTNIFLTIHQILELTKTLTVNTKIIEAVNLAKNTYEHQKKVEKTLSKENIKSVVKLYNYHKHTSTISLTQFQTSLIDNNFKKASINLLIILLDSFQQHGNYRQQTIIEKIQSELFLLHEKGENIPLILHQISQVSTVLNINNAIIDAVLVLEKSYTNSKEKSDFSKETSSSKAIEISAYQEFVTQIKTILLKYTQENIYTNLENLLHTFSNKNHVSKAQILKTLQEKKLLTDTPNFITVILQRLVKSDVTKIAPKNGLYHLDSVQYFFKNNRLPWWIKDKTSTLFRESMSLVLQEYPDLFIQWFKKSDQQKTIVDLMDASIYQTFIKQVNTNVTQTTLVTKLLFEKVLEKDLKGIKNSIPSYQKELQYLFLEYAVLNQQITIEKIADFITQKLAQKLSIAKEDLYVLLLGRIQVDIASFKNLHSLENWLRGNIIPPSNTHSDAIEKIETKRPWAVSITINNSKEIIGSVQTLLKEQPKELLFHLKRASFRSQLKSKLRERNQKEVIRLFFTTESQSKLMTIFEIFKQLQKIISANNYAAIWSYFVDKLLLKIAMSTNTNWRAESWSLLLLDSITSVKHTISITQLIHKLVIHNHSFSEKLVTHMTAIQKERSTILEETQNDIVPEVIEKETIEGTVFIENAGMIILGPYIPMLFQRMGLVENKAFKDEASKQKGMYVLQYAVTGKTDPEEHSLFLNKIICNVDFQTPLLPVMELTSEEKELIDGLLQALIGHWKALGKTSVEGFKVSFLSRPGSIVEEEKKFTLVVEEKSYDMLLDHIPWSIGQIKLSWMEKLIDITWRTNK